MLNCIFILILVTLSILSLYCITLRGQAEEIRLELSRYRAVTDDRLNKINYDLDSINKDLKNQRRVE